MYNLSSERGKILSLSETVSTHAFRKTKVLNNWILLVVTHFHGNTFGIEFVGRKEINWSIVSNQPHSGIHMEFRPRFNEFSGRYDIRCEPPVSLRYWLHRYPRMEPMTPPNPPPLSLSSLSFSLSLPLYLALSLSHTHTLSAAWMPALVDEEVR